MYFAQPFDKSGGRPHQARYECINSEDRRQVAGTEIERNPKGWGLQSSIDYVLSAIDCPFLLRNTPIGHNGRRMKEILSGAPAVVRRRSFDLCV
jgi:hypothetical protein